MPQQDSLLMARALMRSLWQLYDSGGHSGRSLRAHLLEAALWRVRQDDLPSIPDYTYETFQKIRSMTPHTEGAISAPVGLQELSHEMYITLVVSAIEQLLDERTSFTETELVACILHLLNAEQRMEQYRRSGGEIFGDRALVTEGRRRLYML